MGAQLLEACIMAPIRDGAELRMKVQGPRLALTDLEQGETAIIDSILLAPEDQHFLMRIGLVPGVRIAFSRRAPLGDPIIYSVDGTEIALRFETARSIAVQREESRLGDDGNIGEPNIKDRR
jgi:ferrous iron transport protein A